MPPASRPPEVVELELFTHRFTALAREMGEQLRRTAVSVNVKERLDFSCALLDPEGRLVVNAPHIPVHLGALGLCVRSVAAVLPLAPGDVVVTNHPAFGGSHLPDVTVITPVFAEAEEATARPAAPVVAPSAATTAAPPGAAPSATATAPPLLLGYVASRAHHAELGGRRPGSMPPDAHRLAAEGVVIPPAYLARGGSFDWAAVERLLREAPFPSRAVAENLADLQAAVAANRRGAEGLRQLARSHGPEVVRHYMAALYDHAAERLGAALAALPEGERHALERLDDGSPLEVRVVISGAHARIDWSGSAGVHPGNLNAPPAVLRSAVLYVLRLLVDEPLPLNEGLLAPVELIVLPGILDPPFPDDPWQAPAVVGGNVETSQRVVDTLLKALGLAACSQGTMNNLLFGNDRFGYYETVCGGAGAGPGFAGASAVHSHMTNTRITDPEVLEHRYPVRLERFAVRRGSGGRGAFSGGDGAVRELTFLEPVSLSLISQHRSSGPYGVAGGAAGAPGRQSLVRADGSVEELGGSASAELAAGDRLVLETPGGGGWGKPA